MRSEFGIAKHEEITDYIGDLCERQGHSMSYHLPVALFSFDS